MARARNIKPSTFKNELLGMADPLVTILFIGMWTLADKRGRLEDRPLRIKAEILPYRESLDVNGYLTELERLGFIDRYEVDGTRIIQVLNFAKHQNPHKTEKESELPERPVEQAADPAESPEKPDTSASQPSTVKARLNNGTSTEEAVLIPDSLNTDSLIPDSGSSDSEAANKPPDAAADYLKRLVDVHGYSELRLRTKTQSTTQARQWLADKVTMLELDDAVEVSRARLSDDERSPPIAYLAKVLVSNRQNPKPVVTGINTQSGFSKGRYAVDDALAKKYNVVGGAA